MTRAVAVLFSLHIKPIVLAVFLLIFANMAYVRRERGPRTRGGTQRGNLSTRGEMRYARSDGNMFSCLRGINQDGNNYAIPVLKLKPITSSSLSPLRHSQKPTIYNDNNMMNPF